LKGSTANVFLAKLYSSQEIECVLQVFDDSYCNVFLAWSRLITSTANGKKKTTTKKTENLRARLSEPRARNRISKTLRTQQVQTLHNLLWKVLKICPQEFAIRDC